MSNITIQQTLRQTRIDEDAIDIIKKYEPPEGYWLAFSGGKDSIVIYDLAVRAGVKFDAHYSKTTVDPPEVMRFIRDNYPDVIWEKPKNSMFQIIVKHKTPPTRFRRYCCKDLKELGGKGRTVITGIRKAESTKRKKRKIFEESYSQKGKFFLHPIIDWKNQDVWNYIKTRKIPYCELYDRGRTRIGCILCPLQGHKGRVRDLEEYPKYVKAYIRAFDKMLDNIDATGKEHPCGWKTGEDVLNWWIYGDQSGGIHKKRDYNSALY